MARSALSDLRKGRTLLTQGVNANNRQSEMLAPDPGDDTFLAGAGEMGALVRSTDWRATSFGRLADWPQSLRTTMSICLNSRFPIAVYWDPNT